MDTDKLEEILILANWFYSLGKPQMSDKKYDKMFYQLKEEKPDSPVITKTWSEFERPTNLLVKYNLDKISTEYENAYKEINKDGSVTFLPKENMDARMKHFKEVRDYFDQYTLKSIQSVVSIEESHKWFDPLIKTKSKLRMNLSLKGDGFNVSHYYYNDLYVGSLTRGRSGTAEDVSIAMSKVIPLKLSTNQSFIRVKTEATMDKSLLPKLREKDPSRDWKSARNSVKTLLANSVSSEFHKLLIPVAFKIEGMKFDTMTEEFNFLSRQGFKVIENETFEFSNHEEFLNAIRSMADIKCVYETDGVVATIEDMDFYENLGTSGKYDYGMRAYRLFNWQSSVYCSIVLGFEHSYSSRNIASKIKMFPTTVTNGTTQDMLSATNPRRLMENQIEVGSIVAFIMESDSCVVWLEDVSFAINQTLKNKSKLPEILIQPVTELEYRLKRIYERGENINDYLY